MRSFTLPILSALFGNLCLAADSQTSTAPGPVPSSGTVELEQPLIVIFRFDYKDYWHPGIRSDDASLIKPEWRYQAQNPLWIPTLGDPTDQEKSIEEKEDDSQRVTIAEGPSASNNNASRDQILAFYYLGVMAFTHSRSEPRKFSWAPVDGGAPHQCYINVNGDPHLDSFFVTIGGDPTSPALEGPKHGDQVQGVTVHCDPPLAAESLPLGQPLP